MIRATLLQTVATYIVRKKTHNGLLGDHPFDNRSIHSDRSFNVRRSEDNMVMEKCTPTTAGKRMTVGNGFGRGKQAQDRV